MSVIYQQTKNIRRSRAVAGQSLRGGSSGGAAATLVVLMLFMGMGGLLLLVPDKPETVLALGVGLAVALGIIRRPIVGTYIVVIATVLFDAFPSPYSHTFVSDLGIFRNLSYRGLPQAVVISLFEVLVALTLASALVRRFHTHKKVDKGPLFWSFAAFGAIVVFGELNGLLTGGDFKISLWELRPLLYLVILYALAMNTVSEAAHIRVILWLTTISIGARCIEGVFRYFSMPGDLRAVVPVVLEHDDSLFLVTALGLVMAAALWRKWLPRRFFPLTVTMVPLVLYMMQINGRRAAFLCLGLVVVAFLPMIWVSLRSKAQQRLFKYALITGAVLAVGYVAAFWNVRGGIGSPAQSVRSVFQPDERDYLSNLYREQENANLRYTIGFSPIVGIGFGKPMTVVSQMVDLSEGWALQLYMPHNNMLWLWMRMGIVGFLAFWMAIGAAIFLIAGSVRLGVGRLRRLAEKEKDEARLGQVAAPTRGRYSAGEGMRIVRLGNRGEATRMVEAVVAECGMRNAECGMRNEESLHRPSSIVHRPSSIVRRPSPAARTTRREQQECAEFLVLAMLALATLVALIGLAVVDQGLMSFRLAAYSGMIFGTLSAAWNMYQVAGDRGWGMGVGFPSLTPNPHPLSPIDDLPEKEESPIAHRRHMRFLTRV